MKRSTENPFISIFIPTYNRAAFLDRCLASCVDQDYENYEIVVGDDGSTDETRYVATEWARKEPRIRYFRLEENSNAQRVYSLAKNAGGEFLLRLGDDDRLVPRVLSRYAAAARDYNADIVYGDLYLVNAQGTVTSDAKMKDFHGRRDFLLRSLLSSNQLQQPGSMFRTSLFWSTLENFMEFPPHIFPVIPSLIVKAMDYLEWVLFAGRAVFKHMGGYSLYYCLHEAQSSNVLFKNGSEDSFVQRMILCYYGLHEIFPDLDWDRAGRESELRALLEIAKAIGGVNDIANATRFLTGVLNPQAPCPREVTLEALRLLASYQFKAGASLSAPLQRALLGDRDLRDLPERYREIAGKIDNTVNESRRLAAAGDIGGVKSLFRLLSCTDICRTAPAYLALSEISEKLGIAEAAYYYAIGALALGGYGDPYWRQAIRIAKKIGREKECEVMLRTMTIQPWFLKHLVYDTEALFRYDMDAIQATNRENESVPLYFI